jgi:hypothetical protein
MFLEWSAGERVKVHSFADPWLTPGPSSEQRTIEFFRNLKTCVLASPCCIKQRTVAHATPLISSQPGRFIITASVRSPSIAKAAVIPMTCQCRHSPHACVAPPLRPSRRPNGSNGRRVLPPCSDVVGVGTMPINAHLRRNAIGLISPRAVYGFISATRNKHAKQHNKDCRCN